jgi:hypothetical protein
MWRAALALLLLATACGHPMMPPPPGMATVTFTPGPFATAELVISDAHMRLDHVIVLGDVPPHGPPPMMMSLDLDLLAAAGAGVTLTLPQGLYSRVQLVVEQVDINGTWRGAPLHIHVMQFGGVPVDIRSATGQELFSGDTITFPVHIDPASWFAGALLDTATPSSTGEILCDMQNNGPVLMELTRRIDRSFTTP